MDLPISTFSVSSLILNLLEPKKVVFTTSTEPGQPAYHSDIAV
jgi:hypothetical protein